MQSLYDHQKEIIEADPKKCLIAHGTGGGKTFTCLSLARSKTLVVCPKQQKLDRTWEKNAEKFGIEIHLTVLSKEEFRKYSDTLEEYESLIFDECHTILGVTPDTKSRNRIIIPKSSQLFERTRDYIKRTDPKRLYFASATPVTKPMNLWAIATLLGRNWDFFMFRDRFYVERPLGYRSIWLPKKDKASKEKLAELTKSFGYTGQLSDWFDVPEQHHETIYVELTDEQKRAISELESSEADPMAKRAKIRTIENGVLYGVDVQNINGLEDRMGRTTKLFHNNKSDSILSIAGRFKKVLVFAAFTGQVEDLAGYLQDNDYKVFVLTGSTKDRGTVIQAAEEASEAIVIAQASISAGYELPSFRCTVFASKSYRVVDYIQALGRTLRANALNENHFVHLVVKGGTDEACHKTIMAGEDFQEMLMTNI